MVINKKPVLSFAYGRIISIPDTPIDLTEGTRGDVYNIFSRNLKEGRINYSEKTHNSIKEVVEGVWNKPLLEYQKVIQLPNPYRSLDEILKEIDGKRAIIGIGRSALPYLLHTLIHSENSGESDVYIFMPTKWEKSGQQILNPRIYAAYSTIEKLVEKYNSENIVIIDDIMATGFTFRNVYSNLKDRLRGKNIYLVPVSFDIGTFFVSNLPNSGRHLPIESILYEFFTKEVLDFTYGMDKREWRHILESFSEKAGKRYNKKDLEILSELLSHAYPAIVINSSGGEVYPVTHLIKDTEEELARMENNRREYVKKKVYSIYSEKIYNLMDLQARYFQNPLLELLNKYKERIYHAPRTL